MLRRVRLKPVPLILGVLVSAALGGCSTSSPRERAGGGYLSTASAVHSGFDMKVSLMLSADSHDCGDNECDATASFDQRVEAIGQRLALATFEKYPDLSKRFEKFEFVVADKRDLGAKSNGAGTIVVLRGVERLGLDDPSLAFVMAREMAHVVAGHHEDNMLTSIAISVVAQLMLPVLNFARGAAALVSTSSSATTMLTSAASMAGSQAMRANLRPGQLRQAEELGMEIMVLSGYDAKSVVDSLHARVTEFPLEEDWVLELRGSVSRIAKMSAGPSLELLNPTALVAGSTSVARPARQLIASINDSNTYVGVSSFVVPAASVNQAANSEPLGSTSAAALHPYSALPEQMIKGMPILY